MSKIPIETTEYVCGDCHGTEWKLNLGHDDENEKVFLIITCANPSCVEKKRLELGGEPDSIVVWDTFDITSQGYDPDQDPLVMN